MITVSARAKAFSLMFVLASLALPAVAAANLITNGSFEQGAPYAPGTTTVPGWTVFGEGQFGPSSTWGLTPPDGTYNAAVGSGNSFTSGVVSASFSLTAGDTYTFSFDAAGLAAYGPGFSFTPWESGAMGVYYNLATEDQTTSLANGAVWPTAINAWTTTTAAGTVPVSGNYRVVVYQYNNVAGQGKLSYSAMDNFSMVAVPEPGALALAGIGIAAAAWASRRRSHKKPGAEATG